MMEEDERGDGGWWMNGERCEREQGKQQMTQRRRPMLPLKDKPTARWFPVLLSNHWKFTENYSFTLYSHALSFLFSLCFGIARELEIGLHYYHLLGLGLDWIGLGLGWVGVPGHSCFNTSYFVSLCTHCLLL
jgi:hypothetical protein